MQQQHLNKKSLGFTLVEMMVAVSIFSVVALVVTGAVITANEINRKAQAIKLAIDNLNFALENMSLKIRQGSDFYCLHSFNEGEDIAEESLSFSALSGPRTCTGEDFGLAFHYPDFSTPNDLNDDVVVVYVVDDSDPDHQALKYSIGGSGLVAITNTADVNIVQAKFSVWNQPQLGNTTAVGRPRVGVSLRGRTQDLRHPTEFYLQTVASEQ